MLLADWEALIQYSLMFLTLFFLEKKKKALINKFQGGSSVLSFLDFPPWFEFQLEF